MKILPLGILVALSTGCITVYRVKDTSPEWQCAESGLYYGGFDITREDKRGDKRGHIRCDTPRNAYEKCFVETKIEAALKKRELTADFNARWKDLKERTSFTDRYALENQNDREKTEHSTKLVAVESEMMKRCDEFKVSH